MSLFVPVPHYLNYYSFVICLKIRKLETSNFVLFQDHLASHGPLRVHVNFRMDCSILKNQTKKNTRIFDGD